MINCKNGNQSHMDSFKFIFKQTYLILYKTVKYWMTIIKQKKTIEKLLHEIFTLDKNVNEEKVKNFAKENNIYRS